MTEIEKSEGMILGPGVVETIVSMAAAEVEGVASVGSFTASGLRNMIAAKPATAGIAIQSDDNGCMRIDIHIEAYSGYPLPQLAANLRQAISDAVALQVGRTVSAVDVYVDGIQFAS
ncbi:MAG: Asp23/Gls24 family envelope stress response protein [Eggerthellaceae bacterium]|nr:Asp23/Gls24 family envelope stress response protein [Eggerthellaceae bacterium]